MRRQACAAALVLLGCPGAEAAQTRFEVPTIAGPLRVACLEGRHGRVATYALNGRPMTGLNHGCDAATPVFRLTRVWELPRSTTFLLVASEQDDDERLIRLIHVPLDAAPVAVELHVAHPLSARQLSTNRFQLLQHTRFPEQSWTCQYDVDFAAGRVSGRVVQSSETGLDDAACGADLFDASGHEGTGRRIIDF